MQKTQEMRVQSLGWEDFLEEDIATPLQYSCLENPMDRGAWPASPWGHKKSNTTERLSTYAQMHPHEEKMLISAPVVEGRETHMAESSQLSPVLREKQSYPPGPAYSQVHR